MDECLTERWDNAVKLKGIIDEDFINYKEPCMTLEFPKCECFKCDILNGKQVCQNSTLATKPDIEISVDDIIQRYLNNPITKSICCQGLEPFDTFEDLCQLIRKLRRDYKCNDTIIIYTGYTEHTLEAEIIHLMCWSNIIVKFGPFLLNRPSRYDELLGVTLASDNQYAEKIS